MTGPALSERERNDLETLTHLTEPLDPKAIKSREQSGRKLSYVEGWYVIEKANQIFGFDGWTLQLLETSLVQAEQKPRKDGKGENWWVGYIARVRVSALDVYRDGIGFGSGIDSDLGQAHESAIKEAATDALKRALITFGNPFGLCLYDKGYVSQPKEESKPQRTNEQKEVADYIKRIGFGKDDLTDLKADMPDWFEFLSKARQDNLSYEQVIAAKRIGVTP